MIIKHKRFLEQGTGSEKSPFTTHIPGLILNVDAQAINEYFIWGYIPEPRSAWHEINKLQAGYTFNFNIRTGSFRTEKYWDLELTSVNAFKGNYSNAKAELKHLLADAVKIRMHADVNLGVFHSGGIDS
jgi:asparagine synthase (glutamine-hydrolysing)